ncbi:MAG: GspE/PulE family protein, partial [Candidatus Sericytochromatia bacterium]
QGFRLGELLIREGYLTMDALNKVLATQKQQKETGSGEYKPFGQICIDLGLISRDELQRFLKKYDKRIYLGELLINMGLITPKHVDLILGQQKSSGKRFGELLVEQKIISEAQLTDALSVQFDIPRIIPSLELMDPTLMDGMSEVFVRNNVFLPVNAENGIMTVVMADPANKELLKELEKTLGCLIAPAIAPSSEILNTIERFYRGETAAEAESDAADISLQGAPTPTSAADDNSAAVANFLIKNAMADRATDIHIEPQEKYIRIRYRVDGVLHHKTDLPSNLGPGLIARLKDISRLDPKLHSLQEGKVTGEILGRKVEMHISTYPSIWGENVVIRLNDKENMQQDMLLNIDRIGYSPLNLIRAQKILNQPGGLVVVTGPANTGKTTTLYASINYLNQQNRSIITAENPVERPVPGTIQGAWSQELGTSFAGMIQYMLNQDPDILVVGEIDSKETMEAVVEAGLSGAKVLTSYPAFDATGALLRLMNLGLENYLIASSNITVLSQRLVRRLCDACKASHTPKKETFTLLGLVDVDPASYEYFRPTGCPECANRGYLGQTAIHELLQINEAIREAVIDRKPAATIRGIARTEAKLVSMAEDGLFKAIEGVTSIEEVQRVAFVNEYDSQTPWEAEEIFAICSGLEADYL